MDKSTEYSRIVSDCLTTSEELLSALNNFKSTASDILPNTKDGISFFDVKNRQLFSYLSDLSLLMSKISLGQSIEGDSCIDRLIKRRVILEKMKPIETKLRPQVDRLLGKKKLTGSNNTTMRARPDQFIVDDDNDDEDEDDKAEGGDKNKKYVPPKIHAVQYDGDDEEKEQRKVEQARKRMLQSSLVKDLHAQYSQAPEEIVDEHRLKEARSEAERRKYEETYLVRLQVGKKQLAMEQKKRQRDDLAALLNFGDYMGNKEEEKPKGKKRKFRGPKEDKETRAKKFKAAAKKRFTAKNKKPGQKSKVKKRKH